MNSILVSHCLQRLRSGEPQAADDLWDCFFGPMQQVARQRMQNRQWATVDEEDVAISAFRSFCVGVQHGKFSDVVNSGQVWGILAALTSNKAIDWTRHHLAKKRAGERQLTARGGDSQTGPWDNVVDPNAAPADELLMAEEACEQMVQQLRDAVLQEIALLKLEGKTNEEIAAQLGCACRTVERKLNIIRQLWGQAP